MELSMTKFGPAGNSEEFYAEGYKATIDMPKWLALKGLTAYEYQCGKGVNVGEKTAIEIGKNAKEFNIYMSLHAPYFISLSNNTPIAVEKSIGYIVQSAIAADYMGATRIVVHSGSLNKMTREEALENSKNTLKLALNRLVELKLDHITICPELMGKINQIGSFEEVMSLCEADERLIPCIDFGHYNARTYGGITGVDDVLSMLDEMENRLGVERAKNFHCHFSKIEWTKGGEKQHLTFEDEIFGPDFTHIAKAIIVRNFTPIIICESSGTQTRDALEMKKIYSLNGGR